MAQTISNLAGLFSIFNTARLTDIATEMYQTSFLQKMFFGSEKTFSTSVLELHLKRNIRTLADYTNPGEKSKLHNPDPHMIRRITSPHLADRVQIDQNELHRVQFGEIAYNSTNRSKLTNLVMMWMAEIMWKFERTIELQCQQVLDSGQVTAGNITVDYGRSPDLNIVNSGSTVWNNANANPLQDLENARKLITQKVGRQPNMWVMGTEAWNAFRNNEKVLALLDNRSADVGMIRDKRGIIHSHYISIPGIGDVYTYDAAYQNAAGNSIDYIPDKVVYGCAPMSGFMAYGALQDRVTGNLVEGKMLADSYTEDDPVSYFIRLRQRPLAVAEHPDGFCKLTVLT